MWRVRSIVLVLFLALVLTSGSKKDEQKSKNKKNDKTSDKNSGKEKQSYFDNAKTFVSSTFIGVRGGGGGCKPGTSGSSKGSCVATIGAICSSTYDCTGLPNAECIQKVCACKNGYVAHPSMKECLQVVDKGSESSSCIFDLQCTYLFGDTAECKDRTCQCIPGYHVSSDGECIQSKDGVSQWSVSDGASQIAATPIFFSLLLSILISSFY